MRLSAGLLAQAGDVSLCAESGYRVLVKYTPDGGHIKVFSYGTEKQHAICFQDDGIGISKEALKHIFDEYCQEDPSRPGKGIGLGLSVCKKSGPARLHHLSLLPERLRLRLLRPYPKAATGARWAAFPALEKL